MKVKVKSPSRVRLFATPRTAACQASLSITNSQSPPKPMSTESVMPSNYLILCCPLLLLPSIFPSSRVFSNVVWGLPRCVWARESTAPAQGNQSLSRELRASALCPGLEARFPARQTAKASRKQSSLSGKESAQGCIPKRLLGRPD